MITIGLDIGSVAAKGVLLNEDKIYKLVVPTGWSPLDSGNTIINELLKSANLTASEIDAVVVTGYGRVVHKSNYKTVTEIKCHARGVSELYPQARTIVDIGGQDSKVIKVDKYGKVIDFTMNDKCAAGTGKFLQVMANSLGMDVSQLGDAEDLDRSVKINSMCTVFAESEVVNLLAQGTSRRGIIAGLHDSIGQRVAPMAKRMGLEEQVIFTGGVAINKGVKRALDKELGLETIVPEECQFTGALGAALIARES